MAGQLYVVVGPSGVGKDTVLNAALTQCPDVVRMQRVVTRPTDAGGEVIDGVSNKQFLDMQARGEFAIVWIAHGLHYGIPTALRTYLDQGHTVVFNGSRKALPVIQNEFPELIALSITADTETLRARLVGRNRETAAEIEARLVRACTPIPASIPTIEISNTGMLCDAVQQMVDIFYCDSANLRIRRKFPSFP